MNCPIYNEHQFIYDAVSSSTDKSVFKCLCGQEVTEHEDAGTGA